MLRTLLLIILISIIACDNNKSRSTKSSVVTYQGALKKMMRKGDIGAKASLSDYAHIDHLYALGAIENLKGEILIIDSAPYNTSVIDNTIKVDSSYSKRATLLVSAVVNEWSSHTIPRHVSSLKDLEKYIKRIADTQLLDIRRPFPFMIEGRAEKMSWHVIDWKDGDTVHSHKKHVESGLNGTINNQDAIMLGFYSDSHHGIFTHHSSNVHIHTKLSDGSIAGHLDDIVLGPNMLLMLPVIE